MIMLTLTTYPVGIASAGFYVLNLIGIKIVH